MTNYTITSNFDITNLRISDGAYRCYMLLQSLAYGNKTKVYPSIKYMACALGRSCRTINRYIKELIALNLIIRRRRGSISNLYILVQKKVQQDIERLKAIKKDPKSKNKDYSNVNINNTKNVCKGKPKKDKFNDYDQRNYNFKKLEELLLHGKGNLSECQV